MKDDNKKPTVEDQELADMIASMNGGAPKAAPPTPSVQPASARPAQPVAPVPFKPPVSQGPTPSPAPSAPPVAPIQTKPTAPLAPINPPVNNLPPKPATPSPAQPAPVPLPPKPLATPNPIVPAPNTDLDFIKKSAMDELRPLVGRLDLPADEKFDTLLLLIRSTDDKALLGPAHEVAQQITDEKKKAQALLDIVKEIDFFESSGK